jgi:hypothetical protein
MGDEPGRTIQCLAHGRQMQILKLEYEHFPTSTAGIVAGLISIMGLLAILAVIFRL